MASVRLPLRTIISTACVAFLLAVYSFPLSAQLWLEYSTYLGGSSEDRARGIFVENGEAYICGNTFSDDFPLKNPYQTTPYYCTFFISKLSSTGSELIYSTYLGNGVYGYAMMSGIYVESGEVYVTGRTDSYLFPTVNPYQSSKAGCYSDAFVTKLSSTGSELLYSTYLGGGYEEI